MGEMANEFMVPATLKWLEGSEKGRIWLRELSARVAACVDRWKLQLEQAYPQSAVSIVFPATLADGSAAVLKVQYPHAESDHEAEALRAWNGDGVVRLLDDAPEHHALLLERCEPGEHLASIGAEEALEVLTGLLPRLWVKAGNPFRTLREETEVWGKEL